jgi:hypothetical protein
VKSLIIFLLSVPFFLGSSAQAITKRTAKECLICHVLWFDVLKSEKITLIGKKDSPIVIAGSKGLASTKEICISCHDGYVVDSRNKIAEGNPHHAAIKPPRWLKIPEIFRLDSNNDIYCGTCHTLHDIKGSGEVGSTPFLRMDNEKSQMCIACHGGETGLQPRPNHPVLMPVNFPLMEAAQKGSKFGPSQEIICESCHIAHGNRAMIPLFQTGVSYHNVHRWHPHPVNNDIDKKR